MNGLASMVSIPESYTVLVIEYHPLYGEALIGLLKTTFGDVCVVLKHTAEEGLQLAKTITNLRLVILDMGLPGLSGAQAVAAFKMLDRGIPIIAISASENRNDASAAFHAGASTYVSKAATVNDLTKAISATLNQENKKVTCYGPIENFYFEKLSMSLTVRQREILSLICKGFSNKEIAFRLDIAEVTVKLHISAIFRVLGVKNRTQAALVVSANNLNANDQTVLVYKSKCL